jgi:hypothetical protein
VISGAGPLTPGPSPALSASAASAETAGADAYGERGTRNLGVTESQICLELAQIHREQFADALDRDIGRGFYYSHPRKLSVLDLLKNISSNLGVIATVVLADDFSLSLRQPNPVLESQSGQHQLNLLQLL